MYNNLFLFTSTFPFEKGEEFIETEIGYIATKFENVTIFSSKKGVQTRSVPNNVELKDFPNLSNNLSSVKTLIKYPRTFLKLYRLLSSKFRPYHPYLLTKRDLLGYTANVVNQYYAFRTYLKQEQIKEEELLVYTYWCDAKTTMFSFFKLLGMNFKLISRAHEFDLYEETNDPNGFFLYRDLCIEGMDVFYLIAQQGIDYLQEKYPQYTTKYKLSYLGTRDLGVGDISTKKPFQIVSCSYVEDRKRIHLIIDILKHFSVPVKWSHMGSGNEKVLTELIEKAEKELPNNIEFDFKGYVPNKEVLDYYKNNATDLFMLLSESEGLPVSLMEVVSFGIPVVATNVGGVAEIVNETTGILLDKEFDVQIAATTIQNFLQIDQVQKEVRSGRIRRYWADHFNADENYQTFAEEVAKR